LNRDTIAKAQQAAVDALDLAKADVLERFDELKAMLETTSALLGTRGKGNRAGAIRQLSLACDVESDLLGDTVACSGYAQSLGIEDQLSDYEEQGLFR
jgi:hypothetical protein